MVTILCWEGFVEINIYYVGNIRKFILGWFVYEGDGFVSGKFRGRVGFGIVFFGDYILLDWSLIFL